MVSWNWTGPRSRKQAISRWPGAGRRGQMKNPLRTRMFAWWYFSIAGGFLLLAINRWLLGQRAGLVVAQFVTAAAFLLFGLMSWGRE